MKRRKRLRNQAIVTVSRYTWAWRYYKKKKWRAIKPSTFPSPQIHIFFTWLRCKVNVIYIIFNEYSFFVAAIFSVLACSLFFTHYIFSITFFRANNKSFSHYCRMTKNCGYFKYFWDNFYARVQIYY